MRPLTVVVVVSPLIDPTLITLAEAATLGGVGGLMWTILPDGAKDWKQGLRHVAAGVIAGGLAGTTLVSYYSVTGLFMDPGQVFAMFSAGYLAMDGLKMLVNKYKPVQ